MALFHPLTLYTWRPHEGEELVEARPPSNRLVTSAGRNVTGKVTEVTLFVTCYGIHYGVYYGIHYDFLGHFQMSLSDAVHGFREGSDTNSRPFPLFSTLSLSTAHQG